MLVGAHVGVAGGYPEAVDYASSVGCECMQIFCKSPRQWHARPLNPHVAVRFRERLTERGMGPVLVHTAYLINLGSADAALWQRSIDALADELQRSAALGANAVVTHVGTAWGDDVGASASRIASAVDRTWERAQPVSVRLLLENTAAAGTTFGDGPDELGAILERLSVADGVGVCLDTCHAHAAGWDLSQPGSWTALVDAFESCCGIPVEAIHANDCAFPAGEHRDRHAWIGDGTIGYAGFAQVMTDARLVGIPVITEMPGEVPLKDAENLRRLKQLRDASEEPGPSF